MNLAPNPHLSDYLAEHVKAGIASHFALCASLDTEGNVVFYIHPASVSGRTEDYYTRPGHVEVSNKRGLDGLIELAMKPRPAPAEGTACEGCAAPATHSDSEGVPLCTDCYEGLLDDEANNDGKLP